MFFGMFRCVLEGQFGSFGLPLFTVFLKEVFYIEKRRKKESAISFSNKVRNKIKQKIYASLEESNSLRRFFLTKNGEDLYEACKIRFKKSSPLPLPLKKDTTGLQI